MTSSCRYAKSWFHGQVVGHAQSTAFPIVPICCFRRDRRRVVHFAVYVKVIMSQHCVDLLFCDLLIYRAGVLDVIVHSFRCLSTAKDNQCYLYVGFAPYVSLGRPIIPLPLLLMV